MIEEQEQKHRHHQQEDVGIQWDILGKHLHRNRRFYVVVLAVCMLLGLLGGGIWAGLSQRGLVGARVSLSLEDGTGENPSAILEMPSILQAVLAETQLGEQLSVADVQGALSSVPVLAEDGAGVSNLFDIRLDSKQVKISASQGKFLLTSLLNQYRDWFFLTHANPFSGIGNAVSKEDLSKYDYAQVTYLMENQTHALEQQLQSLTGSAPSFRSVATGKTFADLLAQLHAFVDVDLAMVNADVVSNNLSRNKWSLVSYYWYQIEQLDNQIAVLHNQQADLSSFLNEYQKDTLVLAGDATALPQPSAPYDALFTQRNALNAELTQKMEQVNRLKSRVARLENADGENDPAILARVEQSLPLLLDDFDALLDEASLSMEEYQKNNVFSSSYAVVHPAHSLTWQWSALLVPALQAGIGLTLLGALLCGTMLFVPFVLQGKRRRH